MHTHHTHSHTHPHTLSLSHSFNKRSLASLHCSNQELALTPTYYSMNDRGGWHYKLHYDFVIYRRKKLLSQSAFTSSANWNWNIKDLLMGSLHRQVAVLVPDEKLNRFHSWCKKIFKTKRDSFHPGPVETPSGWGLPIGYACTVINLCKSSILRIELKRLSVVF